ncbi:MAG: DUF448 domain-containing protein [Magnetococcales bacterium]|nr:DUF448 domain-containing protein [Magnetococcales bacterium]
MSLPPESEAHEPLRRCAITRNRRPRELLLRFVTAPGGGLVEDLAHKLPGRGIHVLPDQKRVTTLLTRHKMSGEAIAAVLQRLAVALEQRLLDGVGLARRTGECRQGFREVEELLKRGARPLLLLAEDAATLQDRVNGLVQGLTGVEVIRVPASSRLGTIWSGRPVVLVAVTHVGIQTRIRADAMRWWSFTRDTTHSGEKNQKGG